MALRSYTDGEGVTWRVWQVLPSTAAPGGAAVLPEDWRRGWLCFECPAEKRRLTPAPPDWEQMADAELDVLRRKASPVTR